MARSRDPRPSRTLAEEAAERFYRLAELDGKQGRREALKALKKGADVMVTAHGVAQVWRKVGHKPTQAEYAEELGLTMRTAERDFERWREAFCNPEKFDGPELDVYTVAERMVLEYGGLLAENRPTDVGLAVPAAILGLP